MIGTVDPEVLLKMQEMLNKANVPTEDRAIRYVGKDGVVHELHSPDPEAQYAAIGKHDDDCNCYFCNPLV